MKKMKPTLVATLVCACAAGASSGVFAQSAKQGHFVGPALGVSVSAQQNRVNLDPTSASDFTASDTNIDLVGSYGFAIAPQWVGTLGLSYGPKVVKMGEVVSAGVTTTITAKNHLVLSFAPGYRIGADGLLYGKLAFHSLTLNTTSTGLDKDTTHSGTGLGIGYAMAVSPQIELRGEIESVQYSSETVAGATKAIPRQTNFTIGLMYTF